MTETEAESAKNIGLLQMLMWLQYGPFHRITKQPTDQSFSTLHCCSFSRKQNVVSKKSSLSSSGLGKTQVIRSFVEVVKQSSRALAPLSERSGSPASSLRRRPKVRFASLPTVVRFVCDLPPCHISRVPGAGAMWPTSSAQPPLRPILKFESSRPSSRMGWRINYPKIKNPPLPEALWHIHPHLISWIVFRSARLKRSRCSPPGRW
jgi:hypothetical protein